MKSIRNRYLSRDDRGGVPQWVVITIMMAGLLAMLTAVAGSQMRSMLSQVLSSIG